MVDVVAAERARPRMAALFENTTILKINYRVVVVVVCKCPQSIMVDM